MVRDNIAVLVPWPVIFPPFNFGVAHCILFHMRFERICSCCNYFSVGIENWMYTKTFLSQSLNNLFWCESVRSKNSARVVSEIAGITATISLVFHSMLTWWTHKIIWVCIEPCNCNSYCMMYWLMVTKIFGPT